VLRSALPLNAIICRCATPSLSCTIAPLNVRCARRATVPASCHTQSLRRTRSQRPACRSASARRWRGARDPSDVGLATCDYQSATAGSKEKVRAGPRSRRSPIPDRHRSLETTPVAISIARAGDRKSLWALPGRWPGVEGRFARRIGAGMLACPAQVAILRCACNDLTVPHPRPAKRGFPISTSAGPG